MIKIDYYFTIDNKCPYLEWFDRLDNSIKVRIEKRLSKLKQGNYGDYKPLQNRNYLKLEWILEKVIEYIIIN